MINENSKITKAQGSFIGGLILAISLTSLYFSFHQALGIVTAAFIKLILFLIICYISTRNKSDNNPRKLSIAAKIALICFFFSLIAITILSGLFTKYADDFVSRIFIEAPRITAYFILTTPVLVVGVFIFPLLEKMVNSQNQAKSKADNKH
ncbi:MAG: hypothetical protein RLN90_07340 [Balneolaceae bacterium]